MPQLNGTTRSRNGNLTGSTLIATHLIDEERNPSISRANFAHLLQESLGTDDQGQPNLGQDLATNLKLITVIVQIGIEPLLSSPENDPFKKRLDQGKNLLELKCCLQVIHLATQRSPDIIFSLANPSADGKDVHVPVYTWLLPILFSVELLCTDAEVHRCCEDILQNLLKADAKCSCGTCGSVVDLLRDVLNGKSICPESISTALTLQAIIKRVATPQGSNNSPDHLKDLPAAVAHASTLSTTVLQGLNTYNSTQMTTIATFIVQNLLRQSLPRNIALQLKKQLKALCKIVDETNNTSVSNDSYRDLEVSSYTLFPNLMLKRAGNASKVARLNAVHNSLE